MSDVMTPKQRSQTMSHIKGKNTSIEILLRKSLWHRGIRYRKNYKRLPGTPDIAITKYKIAIFCDSEFFHGHNWEIKKQKLGRNMARDRENDLKLIAMDWVPIHFWGQEIQKHTDECVEAVEDLIFELQMMQFDGMIEDARDCVEDIK